MLHATSAPFPCRLDVILRQQLRHISYLPIVKVAETAQPSEPSENGARTLRTRQHGNRSLPLPPIIDPITIGSRHRHSQPKARRYQGGKTELQQALHANVFGICCTHWPPIELVLIFRLTTAQALATPIRECSLTRVRLPTHFLAPFVGRLDPPAAPTIPPPTQPSTRSRKALIVPIGRDHETGNNGLTSHVTHLASSYATIDRVKAKPKYKPLLVDQVMACWYAKTAATSANAVNVIRDWVWEQDNADKVLAILREEAAYRLKRATGGAPFSSGTDETADTSLKDAICLLKVQEHAPEVEGASHLPVYDLTQLLDVESLRDVLERHTAWRDGSWVVVTRYHHAVDLSLALLKLEQYLIPPGA